MSYKVTSIHLPGRVRLEYVQQGDLRGTPVIMLHGVTDSWRSFQWMLPHLSQSINAFALSLRGHGDSERPAAGYAMRDYAADVAAFMDTLGLDQAVIVGHSMSTGVAQRFALDFPQRALGLVLLGAFIDFADNQTLAEVAEVITTLVDPISEEFIREFQVSTVVRPVPPVLIETAIAESLKAPARVWRAAFAGMMAGRVSADLGRIQAATLLIYGDQDCFDMRADQDTMVAARSNVDLLLYEGYGHAMHWEDPARVAADLAAFVGRITPERRIAA